MNWPPLDPLLCEAATCSVSPHCANVYITNRTKYDSMAHSGHEIRTSSSLGLSMNTHNMPQFISVEAIVYVPICDFDVIL